MPVGVNDQRTQQEAASRTNGAATGGKSLHPRPSQMPENNEAFSAHRYRCIGMNAPLPARPTANKIGWTLTWLAARRTDQFRFPPSVRRSRNRPQNHKDTPARPPPSEVAAFMRRNRFDCLYTFSIYPEVKSKFLK